MSFGALFFFFILFMFLLCAFMLIFQQIHFLLQKFDIWQEAGYCLPHLRTICQFIHFSSSCWSFSFSFHIFGLLIDLAVRLWSFEQFFFLPPAVLFLSFSTHGHCSFRSTFLLISKCILLLFQPQMKSVFTFHLSFWAFSFFISFLDFEMRSLMSSVTLSCWVMLFLFVLSHPCRVESILSHFLPWATSISPFGVAWEELGEILKDKLIFSFAALSRGVCQV